MEYFIVYDETSGAVLMRGLGPNGSAAAQKPEEGQAVLLVPKAALAGADVDLGAIKDWLCAAVDTVAEQQRLKYITPGAGQSLTYQYKAIEARAWLADNGAPTPFMTAESAARDMTIADLAAEIVAQVDAWTAIGSAIEGARMGAKKAINDATTIPAIVAATNVTWPIPA